MKMYKSFRVQNFRGFRDLQLDDLARVNLIAGRNNTGKTALLEAIYTYTGVYDSSMLLRIPADTRQSYRSYRLEEGNELVDPGWALLFHRFRTSNPILFCGQNGGHKKQKENGIETCTDDAQQLTISLVDIDRLDFDILPRRINVERVVDKDGRVLQFEEVRDKWISFNPFTMSRYTSAAYVGERNPKDIQRETRHDSRFLSANELSATETDAPLFSDVRVKKRDKDLLTVVSNIEPRLKQIELLFNGPFVEIHGHLKGLERPLPFSSMGEGLRRILSLMLAIATNKHGIILIDEIENGLHHSVQVEVWRAIAEAARFYNVQVFATTHSYEMILAAHEAFQGKLAADFHLFRLSRGRDDNEIRAVSYDEEVFDAAIEAGFEVR